MSPKDRKRGLGRGLSALMADVAEVVEEPKPNTQASNGDRKVPIELVLPNTDQPRQTFSEDSLQELASSIKEHGVIQPLVVRTHPQEQDKLQIVAGERRWRAAQLAQLHEIPVVIKDFSDVEVLEVAIIENIQRADLNPLEEALGYKQLMERFGHTQDKLSQALGKSRSHIANLMRLLNLPPEVQTYVRDAKLSMGHARALLSADNPVSLAQAVIKDGLSVRETEKRAKSISSENQAKPSQPKTAKDADTLAIESELSAQLGLKVSIDHTDGTEGGKITLMYRDFEQLDNLCRLLSGD